MFKRTVETIASADAIWKVWEDVPNWKIWDHGVEYSTIEGPFVTGARGTLKPKAGPQVHTTFTLVEPKKAFTVEAKLLFTRMIVSHFLTESNGKRQITHQFEFKGPLGFFFERVIGRKIEKNLQYDIDTLAQLAEKNLSR